MGKRILIIRLGSLGDIILTSSAIINLKIKYPDSHITYLCKEKFCPVVQMFDGVDEIVSLPDEVPALSYYRTLLELDKREFNIVLDLHGNFRSWLARKTITADETAVYPKRRFSRLLAVRRKIIPEVWPHTIDLYNDAVEHLNAQAFCSRPVLSISEGSFENNIVDFIQRNPGFVLMAPGAAHANKQWPIEQFVESAVLLHKKRNLGVVWAVTSDDENKPSPKDKIAESQFLQLVNCSITSLNALISRAQAVVANDSGIAHLSSAVGTPVVAVFGPTHPALGFAPRGLFDKVIEVDEPCRPCSLHGNKKCYRDQRYCFERVSSRNVFDAVSEIMHEREADSPAVFVDRDGTVIEDKNFLADPEQVEFVDGSIEALRMLKNAGLKLVIISNQSGVARGYFDVEAVERVNGRVMEILSSRQVEIDAIYYCPHHPRGSVQMYTQKCDCRKPAAGMAEDAAYQLGIDLRKSYVIGDKIDDINLAKVIGARALMVRTGYGEKQQNELVGIDFYQEVVVADNLLKAARAITSSIRND